MGPSVAVTAILAISPVFAQDTRVEEIVVTGIRSSAGAAQDIKEQSAYAVDAIVAEDIGKLPDSSVAEALARVSGIQIRRDAGEANSVLIRGLPDVVTLLDGREVFTTTGRYIALGDVPANVLQRVEVYKSNGAEFIEGGIAGTIDVITRSAFDNPGFHVNGNLRAAYNDKADSYNPNVGATISNTWDLNSGGEFGALLGLSYVGSDYHEERAFNIESVDQSGSGGTWDPATNPPPVTPLLAPFVMGYIPIGGDRTRTAANFKLQWRPDVETEVYFDGFVTDLKDEFELDFFVGLPLLGVGQGVATLYPGTNILHTLQNTNVFTITSTQANDNSSLTQQYALGGSKQLGRMNLSTDLAFTTSEYELINPILDFGIVVPEIFVSTSAGGTAQLDYGGAGFDIREDQGFTLENWFDNHRVDNGDAVNWRGDVEWLDFASDLIDSVTAGVRVAQRNADSIGGVPGGTGIPLNAPRFASEFPGLGCISEPMANGGPDYVMTQWFTPCSDFLLNNTGEIREAFTGTTARKPLDPGTYFDMEETTYAIYGQIDLGGELGTMPWNARLGVRVVNTNDKLSGNVAQDVDNDGDLDYTPIDIDNDSTDVLPSINTKLYFSDDLVGRFNYSETISRPDFPDLNPGVSLSTVISNTTGLTGNGGNPNLKPVESNNFDLSLEWYFADDAFLTGAVFYRDFDGYIQPSVEEVNFFGDIYRVTRPGNTGDGNLQGFEIGYQQFYDNLPGILGGLGLQANYTYMDGDTTNLDTGIKQSITGLSNRSYNLILLYERERVSARLAYNWRDEFLDVRNIAAGYDLYVAETEQLDGQISFTATDNITVSLEAINMLDTEF
jgi:TonB-dependent receptor